MATIHPPSVTTVLGPIPATQLGVTLTHEHCLIDLRSYCNIPDDPALRTLAESAVDLPNAGLCRRNPFLKLDNLLLADLDLAVAELKEFQNLGGRTVVDLTLPDIGRNPVALAKLAQETGLNIIAGCGHYIHIAHPDTVEGESIDAITARFVVELQEGIADTGIRPGIIGEIGTSCPIHKNEVKVLRAAGRAHRMTGGVPIAVHLSPAPRIDDWVGHQVLDILESEEVDPKRVLLCHLDNAIEPDAGFNRAIEYQLSLAQRGCFIGYDGCGKDHYFPSVSKANFPSFWCPSDRERAKGAARLLESGAEGQLLLSQDICFKVELMRFGGFGYGHILRTFATNLGDYGVGESVLHQLLVSNPARLLTPNL